MSTYIRITHHFLFAFILLKTLVQPIYIQYYIQHYCEEHPDRRILIGNDGNYSTLILRSSNVNSETVSNEICQIKIIGENIGGIIVVVNNISLNNELDKCDNYIKIDEQRKWCNDENYEKSVTFNKTEIIIDFGTGVNSTSQFELVITTFSGLWNRMCSNPNHIRCHGGNQECIYRGLECDGYHNCPSGSDEEHCPDLQAIEIADEQPIEELSINTTVVFTVSNETIGNETTLTPIITNDSKYETSSKPMTSEATVITTLTPITITSTITSLVTSTEPTINETTTQYHPIAHPMTGGQTAAIVLVLAGLIAIISGTAFYMYKKHNDNRETLYSPL